MVWLTKWLECCVVAHFSHPPFSTSSRIHHISSPFPNLVTQISLHLAYPSLTITTYPTTHAELAALDLEDLRVVQL